MRHRIEANHHGVSLPWIITRLFFQFCLFVVLSCRCSIVLSENEKRDWKLNHAKFTRDDLLHAESSGREERGKIFLCTWSLTSSHWLLVRAWCHLPGPGGGTLQGWLTEDLKRFWLTASASLRVLKVKHYPLFMQAFANVYMVDLQFQTLLICYANVCKCLHSWFTIVYYFKHF